MKRPLPAVMRDLDARHGSERAVTGAAHLAIYAAGHGPAPERVHDEPDFDTATAYQADRGRIIHSAAFRRLEYKTQVFVNHEGDLFRTRLTHTIEVAHVGRRVARTLALNEDLVEAIALAHDLGHTPFGHAGQEALDGCMREHGGFEHNLQSLRVVDELEERYAEFAGLNLTFDTREGILKHCSPVTAARLGEVAERFMTGGQPSLEAQVTNLADEIAYTAHDVDDGLRSELIEERQLAGLRLFRRERDWVEATYPGLDGRRAVHVVVRRIIEALIEDLCTETLARIGQVRPGSIDEVRGSDVPIAGFGVQTREELQELKAFLHGELYRHYRVRRMSVKAHRIIGGLFEAFQAEPRLMPPAARCRLDEMEAAEGATGRSRCVADYIAGMTDRYAIAEHGRLFDPASLG